MISIDNQEQLNELVGEWVSVKLNPSTIKEKLDDRVSAISGYFQKHRIGNAVLGLSGGIDSALVLALLIEASKTASIDIFAETIKYTQYEGIFDDKMVDALRSHYQSNNVIFTESNVKEEIELGFLNAIGLKHYTEKTRSQVNYAMRYLALFGIAQNIGNCITVGTTNKDEFSYVGWFGKTSDMMVDIQPIIGLHKFEVKAMARLLGVPDAVIDRAPVGDLIDESTDEENFGCTYNEMAFYVEHRDMIESTDFIVEKFWEVEQLHKVNKHKYQGQGFNPVII